MSNYNNDAAYAKGFDALSGMLGMFLQDKINRSHVKEDREYNEQQAETRLLDQIALAKLKAALGGEADLYRNILGVGEEKAIPEQTVAGNKVIKVASPTEKKEKITGIDAETFAGLRDNDVVIVPNAAARNKNNYMVTLDGETAKILNGAYGTSYKAGQAVPYNMLSGLSSVTNNQQRQKTAGTITPKDAMSEYNKNLREFLKLNPGATKEQVDAYMTKLPGTKELMAAAGLNMKEETKNADDKKRKYKIMQDSKGRKAKVYEDGHIEEI